MQMENRQNMFQYLKKEAGILMLLVMPVFSFLCFEYVTGNLAAISFPMRLLNVLWFGAVYLLLFLIIGNTRISVPAATIFFYILSLAEAFVELFRGTPIMVWDLLAIGTAASVAGNYTLEISREMAISGVLLSGFSVLAWFFPFRVNGWKQRVILALGGSGAIAGFSMQFYNVIMVREWMYLNMWDLNYTYQEYGYVAATAVSMKYIVKKAPAGYSHAKLKELYRELDLEDNLQEVSLSVEIDLPDKPLAESEHSAMDLLAKDAEQIQPVNLICIMNESLAELKAAGEFRTNQEYFPFLSRLTENTVRGSLCVPVFGGMTSNTEYEFLTGDSTALLPAGSVAYQLYVNPGSCSLVSTLKDQGYRAVAMHPYPKENWNRDVCYRNMGFDEFLELEDFEGYELLRNYTSDMANYQKLVEVVEAKEKPEDSLFIFNVTMQNHGGYEEEDENFKQDVCLTGSMKGKFPWADQYLSLMKKSDEAFEWLIDYFSACEEPTMIVLFGDHQPSVEDAFYDEIAGMPSGQVKDEDRLMWYQTPFLIWTNYEQPAADLKKLGSIYLSSHVLDCANLEMTPYQRYLLEMSAALPVVHPIGCYEMDGTYHSWTEVQSKEFPYYDLIRNYEYMVYNHSLDGRTEKSLFSLP